MITLATKCVFRSTAEINVSPPCTMQAALDCVMVCGGGSRCPGITQRLCRQLRAMLPPSTPPCAVAVPEYMPPSTLQHAAWIGGGLLTKVRPLLHSLFTGCCGVQATHVSRRHAGRERFHGVSDLGA